MSARLPDIDFDRETALTPIERTVRMVATHPEIHDAMAFNVWLYASDYWLNSQRGRQVWDGLSEADKQPWLDQISDELERWRGLSEAQRHAENRLHMRGVLKRNQEGPR